MLNASTADARVVAGVETVCGIDRAANLTCVGENEKGDLGIGAPSPTGVAALLRLEDVLDASVGEGWDALRWWGQSRRTSCVLRLDGTVACWGYNGFGQVGDGSSEDRMAPTPVTGLAEATSVDVGATHACALDARGGVWCWGDNRFGQLGDGTFRSSALPVRAVLGEPGVSISAGVNTTCATTSVGGIYCWGSDAYSLLGRALADPLTLLPHAIELRP